MQVNDFAKVWFKFSRDYRAYIEGALAPDLTENQLVVLEYIMSHQQVKPSDLIHYLATTPAAITTLVDRMEKNGLITRQRDEQDRRVVWICLTSRGAEIGAKGLDIRNEYIRASMDQISVHNQRLLVYLMGKMANKPPAEEELEEQPKSM